MNDQEQLSDAQLAELRQRVSIHSWIAENKIKNEKGDPIDFHDHLFLFDIYLDQSQNIVVMKCAQCGLSTCEILKDIYDAKNQKMDIIFTLPTDGDVRTFVGGKVNRIIANNPILQTYTTDKDSIEQKQVGESMIYFRGTWTDKAAIMVTADRLSHDEKDSSKQKVVADYQARLQHSKLKQTHVFSHPSVMNNGVHAEWLLSDQKEWFITCPHCHAAQYLSWSTEERAKMSVDLEMREFVCKKCRGVLSPENRRVGEWRPRKGRENAKWSGYHVSLMMAVWITAGEIIDKYHEVLAGKQTMDWFHNIVLGLPYAGSGNSVTEEQILGAVTEEKNAYTGRLVVGVDTGIKLRYVVGNSQGLVGYGEMTDYMPDETNKLPLRNTLEWFLMKFPNSVMVIDQGGDIIGSRKLAAKYPGRVFLCHYARDRKTMQLIRWGEGDESGNVVVDRNRMIQLVIDERRGGGWKLYGGTKNDWYDYWLHWSHIFRTVKEDTATGKPMYAWMRSDRDDWVHATVYWRVGLDKFGGVGAVVVAGEKDEPNSYFVNPDRTVQVDLEEMFRKAQDEEEGDWRDAAD